MIPQEMIPDDKIAAVTRGLREAFGVTEVDNIRRLTKGRTSGLVYRIVVRGTPFLMKLMMRTNDPTLPQHFTCLRVGADGGLGPRVLYASIEDRLLITDFVEAARFPRAEALLRMPALLRSLHALPAFPARESYLNTTCTFFLNEGPAVDGFLQKFRESAILPADECEELFARLRQIAAVYPRQDADLVSSHNDMFKPDNILFDGRRVWLVDWEAAFLNDRYADLAVVANLVANDAEEGAYLREYFGQEPDGYQRARFFLMRQLAHMFYAMAFLMMGAAGEPADWSEPAPEFNDFHQRFWDGEMELTDQPTKLAYGRVHWNRLAENMRGTRLDEALRIVADPHAGG